jgi:DnaJ-class molecular chaperone
MRNPYETLGVPRNASPEQIKRAFRKLARDRHPDRHPDDPDAEDAFKEISAAYDVLSDPVQRARFDRGEIDATGAVRRRKASSSARWHGKSPFERFFARDAEAPGGAGAAGIKVDGADVTYTLRATFMEAARGTTKRVSLTNAARLDVAVPAGTRNGQGLRLKGQGMNGIGGGKPGDALIEMIVDPHPLFISDGSDIRIEVPVTLQEAILGSRITVPTIDGNVAMSVPAGSNTGTVLRLRGKGLANGNERGDQYVKLRVVLPQKPDKALSDFISRWAAENDYDVRRDLLGTD